MVVRRDPPLSEKKTLKQFGTRGFAYIGQYIAKRRRILCTIVYTYEFRLLSAYRRLTKRGKELKKNQEECFGTTLCLVLHITTNSFASIQETYKNRRTPIHFF